MALGCLLAGVSFLVMIAAAHSTAPGERGSAACGTVFILTIGELYLSPIGLSLVTKAAPARIVSMMMGVWFLSSFFGNYFAGFLGTFWERMPARSLFPDAVRAGRGRRGGDMGVGAPAGAGGGGTTGGHSIAIRNEELVS